MTPDRKENVFKRLMQRSAPILPFTTLRLAPSTPTIDPPKPPKLPKVVPPLKLQSRKGSPSSGSSTVLSESPAVKPTSPPKPPTPTLQVELPSDGHEEYEVMHGSFYNEAYKENIATKPELVVQPSLPPKKKFADLEVESINHGGTSHVEEESLRQRSRSTTIVNDIVPGIRKYKNRKRSVKNPEKCHLRMKVISII